MGTNVNEPKFDTEQIPGARRSSRDWSREKLEARRQKRGRWGPEKLGQEAGRGMYERGIGTG